MNTKMYDMATSKGVMFVFGLTQSVAASCHEIRAIVPLAKSRNIFAITMQSAK